jgi:hypothetical protein
MGRGDNHDLIYTFFLILQCSFIILYIVAINVRMIFKQNILSTHFEKYYKYV